MIYALWHGGPNYSPGYVDDHTETFSSMQAVRAMMRARMANRDGSTPCVQESSCLVWLADPRGAGDPYPDYVFSEGPRGGISQERA